MHSLSSHLKICNVDIAPAISDAVFLTQAAPVAAGVLHELQPSCMSLAALNCVCVLDFRDVMSAILTRTCWSHGICFWHVALSTSLTIKQNFAELELDENYAL